MTSCTEFIEKKLPLTPDDNKVYLGATEQYLRVYCVGYESDGELSNSSGVITAKMPEIIKAKFNEFGIDGKIASFTVQTAYLHHIEDITIAELMTLFSLSSFEELMNELSDAMQYRLTNYVGINFLSDGFVFIKQPYPGRISRNSFIVE